MQLRFWSSALISVVGTLMLSSNTPAVNAISLNSEAQYEEPWTQSDYDFAEVDAEVKPAKPAAKGAKKPAAARAA